MQVLRISVLAQLRYLRYHPEEALNSTISCDPKIEIKIGKSTK